MYREVMRGVDKGKLKPIPLQARIWACVGSPSLKLLGKEHPSHTKYEKDIRSGKIPCPYTCIFKNKNGEVVSTQPILCSPNGKPKIDLFS